MTIPSKAIGRRDSNDAAADYTYVFTSADTAPMLSVPRSGGKREVGAIQLPKAKRYPDNANFTMKRVSDSRPSW
jgi:hypothetical protein